MSTRMIKSICFFLFMRQVFNNPKNYEGVDALRPKLSSGTLPGSVRGNARPYNYGIRISRNTLADNSCPLSPMARMRQ